VEDELLRSERDKSIRAGITRCRGRKDYRDEGGKRTRISTDGPRNEILDVLALSRRENREEKCGRRLSTIARSRDDAKGALSNPAATSFVAECWTPAATTNDLSGGTPPICDRAGAGDQQYSCPIVKRIVHGDQAIRIDDHFFCQFLCVECGVQRPSLNVRTRSSDATIENAGKHCAWLRNLRKRLRHQLGDDIG
jgi:hypothetical protein